MHAFEHQTFMPPASSAESMSKSRAVGLAIASLLLVTATSVTVVSSFRSPPRIVDYRIHELSLSSDGEIWETETHLKYINSSQDRRVVAGRLISGEGGATTDLSPIAEGWDVIPSTYVSAAKRDPSWFQKFEYFGSVPRTTSSPMTVIYDRVGRFYTYDTAMENGSFNCITPRGVYDSDTVPEGRFRNGWVIMGASLCDTAGELLIADENGVYQVKLLSRQVRKIIDGPVTGVGHFDALNLELDRDRDSLWTVHGDQAKRYEIEISEADEVTTKLTGQWTVDPKSSESPLLRIAEAPNGVAAFTHSGFFSPLRRHYQVLAADGTVASEGEATLHENSNVVRAEYEILLVPPALLVGTLVVQAAFGNPVDGFSHPAFWVVIFLHSLLAVVIAVWVARSRRLSSGKTVLWGIVSGLLGVSMPLAMVAIYRKLTLEPCLECNALRRVDQTHCESCGAAWEALESDGNGIFEHLPEHDRSMASV